MRYWWLVVACVAALAGEAGAKRLPSCTCPSRIALPEYGATDVPINAKVWILGETGATHTTQDGRELAGVEVFAPDLAPNQPFHDTDRHISFTTGSTRDEVAPAAPTDVLVSIVVDRLGEQTAIKSISLLGIYAPDTALVRVDIQDRHGVVSLLTTRNRLHLCEPRLQIAPGKLTVSIRAIDLAGNESTPYVTTVEPMLATVREANLHCSSGSEYPHDRHGGEALLMFLGYLLFFLGWIGYLTARNAYAPRHPAQHISRLVAESVTRRVLRWHVVWSAMLLTGIIGLSAAGAQGMAGLLTPFALAALLRLRAGRRVQRFLEHPDALVVRRGPWLYAGTPTSSAKLRAAKSDFEQARKAGVPTSIVK